jgi:hypothetical protein
MLSAAGSDDGGTCGKFEAMRNFYELEKEDRNPELHLNRMFTIRVIKSMIMSAVCR